MDKISKSRFNYAPTINKARTRFDLSHNVLTTLNTGELVPVLVEPVYPGETFSLKTASLTRLETSIHQTMDNAYIEFAYFFVPNRIIWNDFDKFLGANDDPWAQTTNYRIPKAILATGAGPLTVNPMSLINQLGVPSGSYGYNFVSQDADKHLGISYLPIRGVFQVFNDWYRDENFDSIVYFAKDSSDHLANYPFTFNGSSFNPCNSILHVNRFKDVFSTALPAPQKGSEITIGMAGNADVFWSAPNNGVSSGDNTYFYTSGGKNIFSSDPSDSQASAVLKADLSTATAITINQLRLAIASQAMLERDARGGTRLKEKTYSVWGVDAPDLNLDRSEFLGGKRIPVNMMEVLQTSESGTTVLGTDAGHSKTMDVSDGFTKSFTQYGWIIGFAYARTSRSYSQGIDRKLRDRDLYDLYDPMLDNIGEVGVKRSELYSLSTANSTNLGKANEVFGYQEAWYHLKERTNQFRGYFQTGISGSLESWHYGDKYTDYPLLSASWLKEGAENVDRTIAVSASVSYQWSLSIHFELHATRTMHKYSIPNTFGF